MARTPRIQFPGAFYHIIVLGNQRQDIFIDDHDRTEYLERLKHYKNEHGFILYAYVLMTNHVHLLIETNKSPISKIMQLINFTYTRYFNKKYGKVGHLFQGRYKSFLCDRDEYLLALVRYIHLNPLRAKMVERPQDYKWSSHHDYISGNSGIVDTDKVLRLFSERVSEARKLYIDFIKEAIGLEREDSFYKAIGQQILGDDKFIEEVERKIDRIGKPLKKPSLHDILRAVKEVTGVNEKDIISRNRKDNMQIARAALVGVCREMGYRLVDLQSILKRDLSVLSRLSKNSESTEGRKIMDKVFTVLNAYMQA